MTRMMSEPNSIELEISVHQIFGGFWLVYNHMKEVDMQHYVGTR